MADKRIAVIGAGVIGRTHLDAIRRTPGFSIAGIVEPGPGATAAGDDYEARIYKDLDALIADRPDGAVVATPNETHVPIATCLLEAGVPTLVEKPLASNIAEGRALLDVARKTGVAVMTAHHRRFNPIILKARELAQSERFGHLVQATVMCSLKKPETYFDAAWRRTPGVGGPLLINLIHEIDLLRFIFGEVETVTGIASSRERGLPVEDTAGAILTFRNGGVITVSLTDSASAPWAWDISANENPGRFPAHPVQSQFFAGSNGAFTLPDLTLWSHPGEKSWTETMVSERVAITPADSYIGQIAHFGDVIDGVAEPRCSGLDGARNLAIIDAIKQSSADGRRLAMEADGLSFSPAAIAGARP